MHIPAKVDYGIRALLALAAAGTPQTAEYLAGEQGLPPRFLGAILADLRRAGVVASQRGAEGGYRLARRYGSKVRLDERKLKTARYLFDRHGAKVVFFGRFTAVLRTYAAFLAGASRMSWRRFLPANAAGGIVWAGVYTIASYFAGDTLRRLSGTISVVLTVVGVLAVVAVGLVIRRQMRRLAPRAEAAYPGPLD